MKKLFKALAVVAAVAALGFGFVSCSNDDDEDDGASVVAAYTTTYEDDGVPETDTITFYSDNTYAYHIYSEEVDDDMTLIMNLDVQKGTYTGNPTADGTVVCSSTSEVTKDTMYGLMLQAMTSGSKSLTITNSNCPLIACDAETQNCTISDGATKLTDDENMVFTRK